MKLSQNTINILKNFSSINPSIAVKKGNIIKTISGGKNVFARATVDEVFPEDFAIFELSKLLGVISIFGAPDFEFFTDHLKISEGKNSTRLAYADASLIVTAPEKEIVLPSKDVFFDLNEKDLGTIQKALSVLQVPEMTVAGEDGTIYVKANNNKNPSSDQFSIAVGVTSASFNMIFKAENLKFMPGSYNVNISQKGIAEFASTNVSYWIATEQSSKFGV